jgi:hypothetical protein
MHEEALEFVRRAARTFGPWKRIVEYGSRDLNGSARRLFPEATYIGVDLVRGFGVDVVADASSYRPPWAPDAILCLEVLEHASAWPALILNAWRTAAPHGVFVVTCAMDPRPPHGVDGGPVRPGEHYANLRPDDLLAEIQGHWKEYHMSVRPAGDLQLAARYPIR